MENILTSVFYEDCKEYFAPFKFEQIEGRKADFEIVKIAQALSTAPEASDKAALKDLAYALLDNNKSEQILALEDKCMFSSEQGEALKIVLHYLEVLNSGASIPGLWDDADKEKQACLSVLVYPSLWAYLDDEKKAVVCFTHYGKWQACLFCLNEKKLEALHICDTALVPVVFRKDISEYLNKAQLAGGFYLKEYLPRDIGDLLSKKASRSGNLSEPPSPGRHDKGDLL